MPKPLFQENSSDATEKLADGKGGSCHSKGYLPESERYSTIIPLAFPDYFQSG